MEFIAADDEKGPGLRLKHKVRAKRTQAGREARQISLSGAQTCALCDKLIIAVWEAYRWLSSVSAGLWRG